MSFSKAKLKRFNEVSADSPSAERRDHIKKFLKDVKETYKDTSKDCKEKKNPPLTPTTSDTESVKSAQSFKLFRTPSLPRRLRFRNNSENTPKKESKKDITKNLLAAQNETKENENRLESLKNRLLEQQEKENKQKEEYESIIKNRDENIEQISTEITKIRKENEELKVQEKCLTEKTKELEKEIKMLLESHESEISFLIGTNSEIEANRDHLQYENKRIEDENKSLKHEIDTIVEETNILKLALQASEDQLQDKGVEIEKLSANNVCLIEDIQSLKSSIDKDMLHFAQQNEAMLKQLDDLKSEKSDLITELTDKNKFIQELQEELLEKDIELDSKRDSIRESYQKEIQSIIQKYEQKINTIKEINDMKIKEIESVHIFETSKLLRDYEDKIKLLEKSKQEAIERLNDITKENIRLSAVKHEDQLKALEINIDEAVKREKQLWKTELDKCQKIAESEIIQSELEKQDLKTLLESSHEMLRERDDKIKILETRLANGIDYYIKRSEKLETEINNVKLECARVMTEKYNYQLTLNNTRATVNILMERLTKSDSDVESLKTELIEINQVKHDLEIKNIQLENEIRNINNEMEEYKTSLKKLRDSSQILEREMKEKENIFEKLMISEEETLETVNKIGKLFNDKIDENIDKYFDMYIELKTKYEARETYIKDMKGLLDEFVNGIELARYELDIKAKEIIKLENENKNIKLELMTLRFKCEQFEKYEKVDSKNLKIIHDKAEKDINDEQNDMISNLIIENLLTELENDIDCDKSNIEDCTTQIEPNKLVEENQKLKLKLSEQIKRNQLLQEMIELESENATENMELKKKIEKTEEALKSAEMQAKHTADQYHELKVQALSLDNQSNTKTPKETNANLKVKIQQLQAVNKEQEAKIFELQEKIKHNTPRGNKTLGTPKTPRTPKTPKCLFMGKENISPNFEAIKSPKGILKPRN